MRIIFSPHALLKIRQRMLPKEKILETVEFPDFVQPSYGAREKRYKDFGKNHLQVVVIQDTDVLVVITAHWVARMKP